MQVVVSIRYVLCSVFKTLPSLNLLNRLDTPTTQVRAARHEAERKSENIEDKIANGFKKGVSFFGSNLKRFGGLVQQGVSGGGGKRKDMDSSKKNSKPSTPMSQRAMARERVAKKSMPDSIEVVWHCIPSYFQILKFLL